MDGTERKGKQYEEKPASSRNGTGHGRMDKAEKDEKEDRGEGSKQARSAVGASPGKKKGAGGIAMEEK